MNRFFFPAYLFICCLTEKNVSVLFGCALYVLPIFVYRQNQHTVLVLVVVFGSTLRILQNAEFCLLEQFVVVEQIVICSLTAVDKHIVVGDPHVFEWTGCYPFHA